MSQQLISLNPDLQQLQSEGYEVSVERGHLLLSNVPYVNSNKELRFGTLVSNLELNQNKTVKPSNHVMMFTGEQPCNADGTIIKQIVYCNTNSQITPTLRVDRSFSNKPPGGYSDYHHKFTQYISIIQNAAKAIDSTVDARTFKSVIAANDSDVFNYIDTNSSRAGISSISAKLEDQKIGIIGLGGTGAYILDFVAKTHVKEIHLFDGDDYCQHNAFRSPGATSIEDLQIAGSKVNYHCNRYSKMRKGITAHKMFINESNVQTLPTLDFVFVSIDRGSVKKLIFDYLMSKNTPFVDVGIGLNLFDDKLSGIVRTTLCTPEKSDHLVEHVSMVDSDDDEYSTNIQIAELNALNATLAVLKWKKLFGCYHDHVEEFNSTYTLDVNMMLGDEDDAA